MYTIEYIGAYFWFSVHIYIVGLYYYGFLANEGIDLILVLQTIYLSALSILYNKDVYQTSSIVWSTTFPFNILKSH